MKTYFLIESSSTGKNVVGTFNTLKDAENEAVKLTPVGDCLVDFYVAELI